MYIFMSFYDKKVYFFHNECADSSKPHWELKLFWWNLVYQNTYSFNFTNILDTETTVWKTQSETKVGLLWFFVKSKLAQSATFNPCHAE